MTIAHMAIAEQRCTFEVWDGDIDEGEVRAHLLRLAEDPEWPPGALNLVDLSTMGDVTVPDPELVELLREGTILETELKTALVVSPEIIGTNRPQYDEAARATGVTVFTDSHTASEHLGIPPEITQKVLELLRQALSNSVGGAI